MVIIMKGTLKKINIFVVVMMIAMLALCNSTNSIDCMNAQAASYVPKHFSAANAISLAWSNSRDYKKTKSKIALKKVKYTEALKSIQLKKKNMLTFRWSPLLNFKFPEKPTLEDEYDWSFKPYQIQAELANLQHQLSDLKYKVSEEVSNIYVQLYTAQEKINYLNENIEGLTLLLEQNKARLLVGNAKQSDLDSIQKSIDTANTQLLTASSKFETLKQQLSDKINFDVTSGYTFDNPYVTLSISRDYLENLIQWTLDKSQAYYEAKMSAQLALTSLNSNYSFMSGHYKNDMKLIQSYINKAKAGEAIDTDAFKEAYENFLNKIDSYWNGKKRILFIKIPKEWFKGEVDGVRYIEDDPYVLYTNVLEYIEAKEEQDAVKKEVTQTVRDGFNNLTVVYNAYLSLKKQVDNLKADLEKSYVLNKLGELSFEEYSEAESLYKETQIDMLDALDSYTQTINTYNRTTCGAVEKFLRNESISLNAASGGTSNADKDSANQVTYEIVSKIENNMFELSIHVPEDFKPEITDFELWIDKIQVGERTDISKVIRHLTFTKDAAEEVLIRLYDNGQFIADCEIDAYSSFGVLHIEEQNQQADAQVTEKTVGTYRYTVNKETGMTVLTISPLVTEDIAYYCLIDSNGNYLKNSDLIPVTESMQYFSFALKDMRAVSIIFYNESEEELYRGTFHSSTMTISVSS